MKRTAWGATLAVGLWLLTRRPRLALAGGLAYASHIALDWLGHDTVAPIGVMALWPFTDGFYQSSLFIFEAVSRRVGAWSAWVHNAWAVAREVAILVSLVVAGLACWPGWKKKLRGGGRRVAGPATDAHGGAAWRKSLCGKKFLYSKPLSDDSRATLSLDFRPARS